MKTFIRPDTKIPDFTEDILDKCKVILKWRYIRNPSKTIISYVHKFPDVSVLFVGSHNDDIDSDAFRWSNSSNEPDSLMRLLTKWSKFDLSSAIFQDVEFMIIERKSELNNVMKAYVRSEKLKSMMLDHAKSINLR